MVEQAGAQPSDAETTLADSRDQFVASLGRRLEALREVLTALQQAPRSSAHRDNLRRRIHAFGAAAGVLGFDKVFEAFREAEGALGRAGASGPLGEAELARIGRTFDLVTSLVLGADVPVARPAGAPARVAIDRRGGAWPTSVLVFGAPALLESLSAAPATGEPQLECEAADNAERAEEIVRLVAPDVAVIDADRKGARELVETLVYDPLLDPVRLVAIGTFDRPEAAASLVALGVARVLPKPVSPEVLRRTVIEVARERGARSPRVEPLGTLTVEALGERVAQEIRRGLVDAVRAQNRGTQVALGDGTHVLAAVWASVARIRELVMLRSGGAIRFDASGPEGAIPLAPWMSDDRPRGAAGHQRAGAEVSLSGRTIVVADDDPAIAWFLSGLLRAAGADVVEALDGTTALELTRTRWPDLVISDILMPGLDGFSLCREIKRDIALSDVPVILLSWKEDLLQQVHELGAQADGYLRKEATASVVVQRVREVLLPRARVEARIALGGEAKGRLDGLTPRLILDMVCRRGHDARISIRDAAFLYEVEVRGGRIRAATRTTFDGRTDRGEPVLAALLGVRAGRFAVRPEHGSVAGDWDVSLRDAISAPVRRARGALRAVAEPARITRVGLDEAAIGPYLAATPEPALSVVRRLMEGKAPSDILTSGTPGRLLESVLADLVLHGAVTAIEGPRGEDLWAEGMAAVPRAELTAPPLAPPPPPRDRALRAAPAPGIEPPPEEPAPAAPPADSSRREPREPEQARAETPPEASAVPPEVILAEVASAAPPPVAISDQPPPPASEMGPPVSAEPADAAFLFGDSLFPAAASEPPPETTKEPSRPFSLKALAPPTSMPAEPSPFAAALQSLPEELAKSPRTPAADVGASAADITALDGGPRAVPRIEPPRSAARTTADESALDLGDAVMSALGVGEPSAEPPRVTEPSAAAPRVTEPSAAAPRVTEPSARAALAVEPSVVLSALTEPSAPPEPAIRRGPPTEPPKSRRAEPKRAPPGGSPAVKGPTPKAAAPLKGSGSQGEAGSILGIVAVVAIAATASFALIHSVRGGMAPDPSSAPSAEAPPAAATAAPAPAELTVSDLDLPEGLTVLPGRGVLEIQVEGAELVTVGGVAVGSGPLRQIPLAAGAHAVQIEGPGLTWAGQVNVIAGRRSRVSGPSRP